MILDEELEKIKKKKLEEMKKNMEGDYPKATVETTDNNIEMLIAKYPLVIVDCWAEWCGPCKIIGPVVEELASELQGKVVFGKLNVDQNAGTANKYGIMAIPTLLVFKNGALADQMVGAYPKPTLKSKIEAYL